MTRTSLPPNVYRVTQRRFDPIPGAPWVYWADDAIMRAFSSGPPLGDVYPARRGVSSGDNARFYRFWWEIGTSRIAFGCQTSAHAAASKKNWVPLMKGGPALKWYGNQGHVVRWPNDGAEMRALPGAVIRNPDYQFREGVTWSALTSKGMTARIMPPGFIFTDKGDSVFAPRPASVLGLLNTSLILHLSRLIAGTIDLTCGAVAKLPLAEAPNQLDTLTTECVTIAKSKSGQDETSFDFVAPPRWTTGLHELTAARSRLYALQKRIDDEVYEQYGFSAADRAAIEAQLGGGSLTDEEQGASTAEEDQESAAEAPMTREELAVRWVSYAVGIVLGRFQPGVLGALGSAVCRRADFAIGSLLEPGEAEFDQLVGAPERFAYVDSEGGRHLCPLEVEQALLDLALPDGIAVLDEDHRRDLPTLVEKALTLMLGEESAQEIIAQGAGGNSSTPLRTSLRRFLERDFFTKWHLKWYRKRPVYWPFQSARRSYGLVLFHERVERDTLYVLQRDYLDQKINGLRLQIGDLRPQLDGKDGQTRKQLERQMDDLAQILDELTQFAATTERIVREGYEPQPNWIDDGVILRLAPLWQLIPIWKTEPKKHWERLQRGDFDWAHIAMHYWPDRVREKCKSDKSLAIAHGV